MAPIPKRDAERRRRNVPTVPTTTLPSGAPADQGFDIPPADPMWNILAREWYESLAQSGMSYCYEPSDWAHARYTAEVMHKSLIGKPSGQLVSVVMAAMGELLTTEGARRRVRMELTKDNGNNNAESAGVTALNDYRRALHGPTDNA